jgi:xylulose-5-phosphate/fructose-6-phosphate phosphoketolase
MVHAGYQGLKPMDWKKFQVKKGSQASCMLTVGKLLDQVVQDNPKSFRIFCPDEFESNKLSEVFDHTRRNFQWDQYSNARGCRVIETLSEHQCQGT